MPRQTSIQLTEATDRQLEALKAHGWGTATDIIRLAVDRMYRAEFIPAVKVGDVYTIDNASEDLSHYSMPEYGRYRGRFEITALNDVEATVHYHMEQWDEREPGQVASVTAEFDWPLVGIEVVGGYRWTKQ